MNISKIIHSIAQFMEAHIWYTVIGALLIGYLLKPSKKNTSIKLEEKTTNQDTEIKSTVISKTTEDDTTELTDLKNTISKLEITKKKLEEKLKEAETNYSNALQNTGTPTTNNDAFTKEIKKLKDELEELEEEKEDVEKKYKRLKNEKEEIEEKLDHTTSEKKQLEIINSDLEKEKEKLNNNLVETKNKLEENINDLKFINGILDANNSTNKDVEDINHKTWDIYSYYDQNISYLIDDKDLNLYFHNSLWQWGNSEIKTWVKNKRIIAIVGEFSSGKTSIVNRILTQDDPKALKLPTSSKETTAIPTYISNGHDFNCQLFSPDDQLKNVKKEVFEMVTKSVLDKVNVSSLIKYFVLSYKNKNLEGLSILDTPGFGSNSDEIIKRTSEVVKEAHALFWVIDANTGDINTTSINVMKEYLKGVPLYFIINKSDTKSPSDLDKLEKRIIDTAHHNNITFKEIIRFNQNEDVSVLMNHINKISNPKQINPIKEIIGRINQKISELEKEKNDLNKNNSNNNQEIEKTLQGFNYIKQNIDYHSSEALSLLKYEEKWFVDNYYKVSERDYGSFNMHLNNISDNASKINAHIDYYDQEIKTQINIEDQLSYIKYKIKELNDAKNTFQKLVSAYKPDLLK